MLVSQRGLKVRDSGARGAWIEAKIVDNDPYLLNGEDCIIIGRSNDTMLLQKSQYEATPSPSPYMNGYQHRLQFTHHLLR